MGFWQQLGEAVRGQIEDFFRVRWQAVALMFFIIAGLIDHVYLRTTYGTMWWGRAPFWSLHALLYVGTLLALLNLKRFLR